MTSLKQRIESQFEEFWNDNTVGSKEDCLKFVQAIANETLDAAIGAVPPQGYSSIKEGHPVYNSEAKGFNKAREQTLLALEALKKDI